MRSSVQLFLTLVEVLVPILCIPEICHYRTGSETTSIICQYTLGPGPMDDGFYKIQFVPDPSLLDDTTGADSHDIALNQRDTVKLDFALQIYVH
jgi:hypothetical protein